jgi:hypothetical protein
VKVLEGISTQRAFRYELNNTEAAMKKGNTIPHACNLPQGSPSTPFTAVAFNFAYLRVKCLRGTVYCFTSCQLDICLVRLKKQGDENKIIITINNNN